MSTLHLDSEHSRIHLDAVETLKSWGRSSTLLIDGWDDDLHRSLYGTVSGKVVEPTVVMGLQDLTGQCGSSKSIFEAAKTAVSMMGIENMSCFLAAVTDNPSVMKGFRKMLEKDYLWIITLPCWAHGLNTLVGEICRYVAAKTQIQSANRIVTFFNMSHYWGRQLKAGAKTEGVTRGLKKNCESRWYALILLLRSVVAHRTPLSTLLARPEARKMTDGMTAVNPDVIRIVQDTFNEFWPMVGQTIRIAQPFVDVIADSEGRGVTLADCMLNLLRVARQLSPLKDEDEDDREFKKHAYAVMDKRFNQMATPLHRLALFLNPLCRKLAATEVLGFTLHDMKTTALSIAKDKWKWKKADCAALSKDLDEYHACHAPFNGGQPNAPAWWKGISKKHKSAEFALAIPSIVPYVAEIERLFLSCNGIQSPKRNSLAVDTFSKLAKICSSLVEEAKLRAPLKKPKPAAAAEKLPAAKEESLKKWVTPLTSAEDGDGGAGAVNGVDAAFDALEKQLEAERLEEETAESIPAIATVAAAKGKQRASPLSLMAGQIYDFELVKQALNNVVPREEIYKVNVVWQEGDDEGDWDIKDLL
uniref:DUF659 domain-containing protein n=1 Tax=Mycena chlorophos TaxID=658473 RepID=A0ABQ0L309_MYCCL|nr:predicted protein [Mycena chlorophos]